MTHVNRSAVRSASLDSAYDDTVPPPSGAPAFEYPAFYQAASSVSKTGQDRYMRAVRIRLVALVLAAVGGALSWTLGSVDVLAWLALVAFTVSLGVEIYMLAAQPDQLWYEGRAAAESVKTLSWRYAVCGDPFNSDLSERAAAERFRSQVNMITEDLHQISIPPIGGVESLISSTLTQMRLASFDERRYAYCVSRIEDQVDWYATNARKYNRRLHQFLLATIVFESLGMIGAALRLTGLIEFDLLGVLAVVTAGLASWAQTRQYGSISRAYAIASHELISIKSELEYQRESEWSRFVDAAEEAISREHTLWRASKGVLRVPRAPQS
jgi:hypothetical protein